MGPSYSENNGVNLKLEKKRNGLSFYTYLLFSSFSASVSARASTKTPARLFVGAEPQETATRLTSGVAPATSSTLAASFGTTSA